MAAPDNKSIKDLNGKWVINKKLSDDPDPVLAMQGVPWLTRKAISWATVTLAISEYTATTPPSSSTSSHPSLAVPSLQEGEEVTHIDIRQTATGGIKGTTELRILDWTSRDHEDHIFGKVRGRTRFVRLPSPTPTSSAASPTPTSSSAPPQPPSSAGSPSVSSGQEIDDEFLRTGWLVEVAGEDKGVVVQGYTESLEKGRGKWTAEQVWGFASVDVDGREERRHSRRVLARKGKESLRMRLVYDWVGEK